MSIATKWFFSIFKSYTKYSFSLERFINYLFEQDQASLVLVINEMQFKAPINFDKLLITFFALYEETYSTKSWLLFLVRDLMKFPGQSFHGKDHTQIFISTFKMKMALKERKKERKMAIARKRIFIEET